MIIHVDMDAFFAAVEERDFPSLKGQPVAVGGSRQQRGVISTANYIARKYGVKSALPTSTAFKLCPNLILRPSRMSVYVDVSQQIREIFNHYTSQVEPLSLDEAFLDVSASKKLFGDEKHIAKCIKDDIQKKLNLTASVGIARNKFLAKLASDYDKPNGFYCIEVGHEQAFLDPLPIHKIWGVGPATLKKLQKYQLYTIADMRGYDMQFYNNLLGQYGHKLWQLIHAQDNRQVQSLNEAKSISQETTFAQDIVDLNALSSILTQQVEAVCYQLRHKNLYARTLSLKIRTHDFKRISRDFSFPTGMNSTREFLHKALSMLTQIRKQDSQPLRLIGFGVSNFCNHPEQHDLLNEKQQQRDGKIDALSDLLHDKYGTQVLHSARSMQNVKNLK